MNARGSWRVGDAVRLTPEPLVAAYGPALETSEDRCPSLRGTIVEIDHHGEPCRMKVEAVEGDWSLNTRWWQGQPTPGDIVIMEPTTKSGVIEALDAAEIGSVPELLAAAEKCLDCGAQLVPCTCSPRCPGGECPACRGRDLTAEIDDFLANVAKLDATSPLQSQAGRNWSRKLGKVLVEG